MEPPVSVPSDPKQRPAAVAEPVAQAVARTVSQAVAAPVAQPVVERVAAPIVERVMPVAAAAPQPAVIAAYALPTGDLQSLAAASSVPSLVQRRSIPIVTPFRSPVSPAK